MARKPTFVITREPHEEVAEQEAVTRVLRAQEDHLLPHLVAACEAILEASGSRSTLGLHLRQVYRIRGLANLMLRFQRQHHSLRNRLDL